MPLDSRALVPQELLQVPCKWSWVPQPAGVGCTLSQQTALVSPLQLCAVNERGAGPRSEVVEGWTLPDKPGTCILSPTAVVARQHARL